MYYFCQGVLVKFDGVNWTEYTTDDSGLPNKNVHSLAPDAQGNLWIGTFGGLGKFDGEIYTSKNSGLPHNDIGPLVVDAQGSIWIGTYLGLAKFDGEAWTVYDSDNSGLPDNHVRSLAIDAHGNVWIGTGAREGSGLAVYREGGAILPNLPTNAAPASWGQLKAMFR